MWGHWWASTSPHDLMALSQCAYFPVLFSCSCHQSPPKYASNPSLRPAKYAPCFLEVYLLRPFYQVCVRCDLCDLVPFLNSQYVKLFSVSYLILFNSLSVVEVSSCNSTYCCKIARCFKFKLLWPLINDRSNHSTSMESWEGQPSNQLALWCVKRNHWCHWDPGRKSPTPWSHYWMR